MSPRPCPPVIRGPDITLPTSTKGGELILPGPFQRRVESCMHEDADPADGSRVACVRKTEHDGPHLFMRLP